MSEKSREQVWAVFSEALQTFDQKNLDYGDAWRRSGWRGNLPRIFEKVDRVRELLWRPDPRTPAVNDESAVNTLVDLMNSIAFTVINLREEVEYGHEVPRSERSWVPDTQAVDRFYSPVTNGPGSAWATEAPTTVTVPEHLLPAAFTPMHVTPVDEESPALSVETHRPVVDNPQA